jgi:thiol-disulfide isomerase/thioredoxin
LAAKLGDPAGALAINAWVKGKPVDVKDGKNIYVVEFWATWCGPCRVSIPHLTELQKKFKDKGVVFVGISDEPLATVKPFVDSMAAKMDYVIACDDNRLTNDRYMAAYGQGGIPTAFIVGKDGKVLWVGHPMAELETTLNEILAGKYDLQAVIKRGELRAAMENYHRLSLSGDAKAQELGRKILTDLGSDITGLCSFAFGIGANTRNPHRDFSLADEALRNAEKAAGSKDHRVLSARSVVQFESGKHDEGLALAKEALALAPTAQERAQYQNILQVLENLKKTRATKPPPIKPVR